jgi:hypothetical protein
MESVEEMHLERGQACTGKTGYIIQKSQCKMKMWGSLLEKQKSDLKVHFTIIPFSPPSLYHGDLILFAAYDPPP